MRWQVYLFFAFFAVVLDTSFMSVMQLHNLRDISPHLGAILVVFTCLFASRTSALVGCLFLGILLDLSIPLAGPGGRQVHLVGPNALGLLFAGVLIVQMRTMVFRQRAITIGALTVLAVITAGIVALAIFVVRSWYGEGVQYMTQPSAMGEVVKLGGIALYSGLLAVPVGWVLLQTAPLWGFQASHHRRVMR